MSIIQIFFVGLKKFFCCSREKEKKLLLGTLSVGGFLLQKPTYHYIAVFLIKVHLCQQRWCWFAWLLNTGFRRSCCNRKWLGSSPPLQQKSVSWYSTIAEKNWSIFWSKTAMTSQFFFFQKKERFHNCFFFSLIFAQFFREKEAGKRCVCVLHAKSPQLSIKQKQYTWQRNPKSHQQKKWNYFFYNFNSIS